ncbi:cryptochrome/photolyase family protein [Candidatus Berkiella aquae]|uniref:Cryptochrome/photolyase family protein n=1 Tax=Candidatus Berkiella aquae TaxID=295108 RepID=A0A0Q9YIF7_9GAMM|nr:cryptochrome/photolyase family protein [Candidatus Berkiella aquae]MCS5712265.1 cryptochrome/photolyase family protein [Candidatus Berkiella aquae]
MKNLIIVLWDQLTHSLPMLAEATSTDIIFMCECREQLHYIPHHPKKIAFILSSMRHFAEELMQKGLKVHYVDYTNRVNNGELLQELQKAINKLKPTLVTYTEPSEWHIQEKINAFFVKNNIKFKVFEDARFLCSKTEFAQWANNKKQLRMEYFYRTMRLKYNILLNEDKSPIGGKWNYDVENRKAAPNSLTSPNRISHKKDDITLKVIELVKLYFNKNFGDLEPFYFATNRQQALKEAQHFIEILLYDFGTYQDAMISNEAYLYHSLLSSYINLGLLSPLELCGLAEEAYQKGLVPLNSAEGFIRQILGWREYVRGIYWLMMPKYISNNYFDAKHPLPWSYWGGETKMNCIKEVVKQTREHAYSHHIQRLMITGNFALLTGLNPLEVHRWYLSVYADAFEWVELPNTLGMALFGDGGLLASKPYCASGKYIKRMSNFCKSCDYNPEEQFGENACPFNALYWNFLIMNEEKLKKNQRMKVIYQALSRFSDEKKNQLVNHAQHILLKLEEGKM